MKQVSWPRWSLCKYVNNGSFPVYSISWQITLRELFFRFPASSRVKEEKRITKCSMCWKYFQYPASQSLIMRSTTNAYTMHIIYPTLTCRRTARTDQLTHLFRILLPHTKTNLVVRSLGCSSNKQKHLFQAIWSKWNASSSRLSFGTHRFYQREVQHFWGIFSHFSIISRQWGVASQCVVVSSENVIVLHRILNHLNSSCFDWIFVTTASAATASLM